LYGCETWVLALREKHRLLVLENNVGPEGQKLTGGWRKLLHKQMYNLDFSLNIIGVIKSKRM
jgi:hypothetical protein